MKTIISRINIALMGLTFILFLINTITPINPIIITVGCALTVISMLVLLKYGEKVSTLSFLIWILLLLFGIFLINKDKQEVKKETIKTEITYRT